MNTTGNSFIPCDFNLSRQLEDGYRKYKPWSEKVDSIPENGSPKEKPEARWALFGPL